MLFEKINDTSPLEREVFEFVLTDKLELYLYDYQLQIRDSTRHKFNTIRHYNRTMRRDNTIHLVQILIPDGYVDDVKQDIVKQIIFKNENA